MTPKSCPLLAATLIVAVLILPGNLEIGFIVLAVTLLGGLMSQRREERNSPINP